MPRKNKISKLTPFLILITLIFILSIYLFPPDTILLIGGILKFDAPLSNEQLQSFRYTIPSSNLQGGEVVGYKSYAEDTSGNWNVTEIKAFTVQKAETITTIASITYPIDVKPEFIDSRTMRISWYTNNPTTSQVEYGLTDNYGLFTKLNSSLVTYHVVDLTDLEPFTMYHFRVISTDVYGNGVFSHDLFFTTIEKKVELKPFIESETHIIWADGFPVFVKQDVNSYYSDMWNVTIEKPTWEGIDNLELIENNISKGFTLSANMVDAEVNLSKPIFWRFELPAPRLTVENETLERGMYKKHLTIASPNSFVNVSVNISVNESYRYWKLWWFNGSEWIDKTVEYNLSVVNGIAIFSGFSTSNQSFEIEGSDDCLEVWSCTDWSSCNNVQTRTCRDSNDCGTTDNKPAESQACQTPSTSSSGSPVGGGSGTTISSPGECITNYVCDQWAPSICPSSGKQTRKCVDKNGCSSNINEERVCESIESCSNNIKDNNEEGIDCGGSCNKTCEGDQILDVELCGNGKIDPEETFENCCVDVECLDNYSCKNNKCVKEINRIFMIFIAITLLIVGIFSFLRYHLQQESKMNTDVDSQI